MFLKKRHPHILGCGFTVIMGLRHSMFFENFSCEKNITLTFDRMDIEARHILAIAITKVVILRNLGRFAKLA
jgi:hypothetical protein